MKLEPNMYVRTKGGYILKYPDVFIFDEVLKASHNIIDLIEVGDYVNGYEVTSKDQFLGFGNHDWYMINDEIKSIVTKEQFESMSYKVGD